MGIRQEMKAYRLEVAFVHAVAKDEAARIGKTSKWAGAINRTFAEAFGTITYIAGRNQMSAKEIEIDNRKALKHYLR